MYQHEFLRTTALPAKGLNLQAVFNLDSLPADIVDTLQPLTSLADFRQLILIGHGGRLLWQQVKQAGMTSAHPIDDYSRAAVEALFAEELSGCRFQLLFPGNSQLSLQRLGELAGWHRPSPFRVGINSHWGSWFAYRAVVLADTALSPTVAQPQPSPCASCRDKPCISHCPAAALADDRLDLEACISYRLRPDARCKAQCRARWSCPVAVEHRYSEEQFAYHYGLSMRTIEAWHAGRAKE